MGKKQYINKVKRGVMKVKDLLDLINLNSNQGVIKGLPSNLLGQPRFGIDVPCNDSLDPNRD